jgi:hypothetical protein
MKVGVDPPHFYRKLYNNKSNFEPLRHGFEKVLVQSDCGVCLEHAGHIDIPTRFMSTENAETRSYKWYILRKRFLHNSGREARCFITLCVPNTDFKLFIITPSREVISPVFPPLPILFV